MYKNVPELQTKLEQSIYRKLVPTVEDLRGLVQNCISFDFQRNSSGAPPAQRQPQPEPRQPPPYPQPDPYYDPLRVPPTMPRYPGAPPIGGDDLFPGGAG